MAGYRKKMSRKGSRSVWRKNAGKHHQDNDRRPARGGRRK